MKRTIVTVENLTRAIKARKILRRAGINVALTKLNTTENMGGCIYGLEFSANELYGVAAILRESGINFNLIQI